LFDCILQLAKYSTKERPPQHGQDDEKQNEANERAAAAEFAEIRKVVWPTRQETTQTAIAVFVFTLVMALFFWGLDSFLLWLTRNLVGSTG